MSLTTMYLHNLAKRAMTDVTEVASNVGSEIADKASDIWDFVTSIF